MNFATYPAKSCGTSVITFKIALVNFVSRYFYRHLIALVIWLRLSTACSCQPIDVNWLVLLSDCTRTCQLSAFVSCFLLSADCSCQLIALASWFFCHPAFSSLSYSNCPLSSDCFGHLIALVSWLPCQLICSCQLISFFNLLFFPADFFGHFPWSFDCYGQLIVPVS